MKIQGTNYFPRLDDDVDAGGTAAPSGGAAGADKAPESAPAPEAGKSGQEAPAGDDKAAADGAPADGGKAEDVKPDAQKGKSDAETQADKGAEGDSDAKKDADGSDDKAGKDADKDWRKALAGDNEKDLETLKRFPDVKSLWNSYKELRARVSDGTLRTKPPENATDEQMAEWRTENGIPETPEGYLDKITEGLVIGDDVKEGLGDHLQAMHEMNVPPEIVAKGIENLIASQEADRAMLAELDQRKVNDAALQLHEEWGDKYSENVQGMYNLIDTFFPEDVRDLLKHGRLGDDEGTPLFGHPEVIRAFASLEKVVNPMGTRTTVIGSDALGSIEAEIKQIEDNEMGKKTWYKDDARQARYRELVNLRDRYGATKDTSAKSEPENG